ncbi:hypothetical protein [uncultured Bilophila sp.]|uniref:hypothetical protein n=1 Tax=uncultured Bilophila sp. TaxID=529385 RepID=UPI002592BB52|nr:hypothetical protein [uncultured Bilophila sp.]
MEQDAIRKRAFREVDLADPFFDSLKSSYKGFSEWFYRKNDENAYVSYDDNNMLQAFLYMKREKGPITDITPPINAPCLKIGTFKINAHGTKLGERFIKIIVDTALSYNLRLIYVTVFDEHEGLTTLLTTYGFYKYGEKITNDGKECVYIKDMSKITKNMISDYPVINSINKNKWIMSIHPQFHTSLFPDSRLCREGTYIQDTCYTNSIHKVYVGCYRNFPRFATGDCVVIYRCQSPGTVNEAWYKSVATSICVVEEATPGPRFKGIDDFIDYCKKYSVFDENELRRQFGRIGVYAVKMLYNLALSKRINMKSLVEHEIIPSPDQKPYYGLLPLTDDAFVRLLELGEVREGSVIY